MIAQDLYLKEFIEILHKPTVERHSLHIKKLFLGEMILKTMNKIEKED